MEKNEKEDFGARERFRNCVDTKVHTKGASEIEPTAVGGRN